MLSNKSHNRRWMKPCFIWQLEKEPLITWQNQNVKVPIMIIWKSIQGKWFSLNFVEQYSAWHVCQNVQVECFASDWLPNENDYRSWGNYWKTLWRDNRNGGNSQSCLYGIPSRSDCGCQEEEYFTCPLLALAYAIGSVAIIQDECLALDQIPNSEFYSSSRTNLSMLCRNSYHRCGAEQSPYRLKWCLCSWKQVNKKVFARSKN